MNRICDSMPRCILGFGLTLAMLAPSAQAAQFKVLYNFQGGSDGGNPYTGLVPDGQGGYYGTTSYGGGTGCGGNGCGMIYDVSPDGIETVAYAFAGDADGRAPYASLTPQKDGSFLGTTSEDGRYSGGTIFTFTPPDTEAVQYSFGKGIRGWNSQSAVISDKTGNLYGATLNGGAQNYGTIFRFAADGKYTTLHEFRETDDGASPNGPLIRDKMGNLYGTTSSDGCGVLFEIAPNGTETVLHAFGANGDGCSPEQGLIEDAEGNFYGSTEYGGANDKGAVFKVSAAGAETILYSFLGASKNDGEEPMGGLILDKTGNLYGTTTLGGGSTCFGSGCGTVFRISPAGTETLLHVFQYGDGYYPVATLVAHKDKLYGTTYAGGQGFNCDSGCGTVFMVKE